MSPGRPVGRDPRTPDGSAGFHTSTDGGDRDAHRPDLGLSPTTRSPETPWGGSAGPEPPQEHNPPNRPTVRTDRQTWIADRQTPERYTVTYPQNQDPNQQPPYSQQYPQGHPAWTALPPPQPQDQQQPPKKSNVATVITVIVMLALCLGCFGFIATAFTGEGETATAPAETTTAPADTATEAEPVGYLIGASVTALCPEYTDQLNDFQDKYSN